MATTGSAVSSEKDKIVPVTISSKNGVVSVSPDPFHISQSGKEQVLWETDPLGEPFKVKFVGKSPFASSEFDEKQPYSGAVTNGGSGVYKYNVKVRDVSKDPGGIVDQ